MEKEQKKVHTFDRFFTSLAVKYLIKDEQDPRKQIEQGHQRVEELKKQAIYLVGYTMAGLALGGAKTFGNIAPFGCAFLSSCHLFLPVTTLAASIGALLRRNILLPIIYILLFLFRITTRMWLGDDEGVKIKAFTAALSMALYGLLTCIIDGVSVPILITAGISVLAAGLGSICFDALQNIEIRYSPLWETGVFLFIYAISCALKDITFFSISLSYIIGFLVTVYIAAEGGPFRGSAAGLLWGLGCKSLYAPAFALAGLIAGKIQSMLLGVGGGAILCMVYASWAGGYHAIREFLPDISIAAVLYAPLFKYGIIPKTKLFGEIYEKDEELEKTAYEAAAGEETESRLSSMSEALHSLSAIFYGMSDRIKNTDSYEASADMTEVFASDYASMADLIKNALAKKESSIPDEELTQKVKNALSLTNFKCRTVTVCGTRRKTVTARGVSKTSAAIDPEALRMRLSNICGLCFTCPTFEINAESTTMTCRTAPRLQVEFAHAGLRKKGESVSGDCVTCFYSKDDYFYALLCDGMGSGKDAAVAARTCCVFLQKMLEGGNDPDISIEMLNAFLRGKGYECFATIDLFCIDLFNGTACFIKGGSAPSYLVRAEHQYKITSTSTPVGIIKEVRAERISFQIQEDDCIIMFSDGVEDVDSPLIADQEQPSLSGNCQHIADNVLALAKKKHGNRDDATVCVCKINRVS
ncbi:MAG: SpoIIE family protein phosphatase [Clostridiales bacterium]|nr:SpoIIE family protein phosphatase [Clostridiales bacterium]